jgi:hypothetical protein
MPTVSYDLTGDNADLVKAIDDTIKKFDKLDKSGGKVNKTLVDQEKQSKKTGKETHNLGNAQNLLADKMGISGSSIESVTGLSAGMALGLAAVAAAAIATAAAMFSLANANSEYVDEIGNMAAQTGLSNQTLIALDLAAGRAGLSLNEMESGLRGLTQKMGDAIKDGGGAVDTFTDLGFSLEDIQKGSKDSEFALRRTLDVISQLPTEAERASAAIDVFGGRGAKLAAVLKDGSAGLDEMVQRSKELGLVIGEDNVKASEEMDRAMTDLNASVQAFKNNMGADATEAVVSVVDAMTQAVLVAQKLGSAYTAIMAATAPVNPLFISFNAILWTVDASARAAAAAIALITTETENQPAAIDEVVESLVNLRDHYDLVEDVEAESFQSKLKRFKEEKAERVKATALAKKLAGERQKEIEADAASEQAIYDGTAAAWRQMLKDMEAASEQSRKDEAQARADDLQNRVDAGVKSAKEQLAAEKGAMEAAAAAAEEHEADMVSMIQAVAGAAESVLGSLMDVAGARSEANAKQLAEEMEANEARRDSTRAQLDDALAAQNEYNNAVRMGDTQAKKALEASGRLLTDKDKERLKEQLSADREKNRILKEEAEKAAKVKFAIEKASAILSIGISTAKAVMAAAPNAIAMGAMGVVGAAQIALVAGKQPPSFHDGGLISNVPGAAPDEVAIKAKTDEFVVNSLGAANNRESLEAMNRGETAGAGSVTVVIDGAALDDHLVRAAQGDGDVGALFRDPSPKGRNIWR